MMDDYSADIFTTGLIVVGGDATQGIAGDFNDRDWFRIVLDGYYTYEFLIEQIDPNQPNPLHWTMDVRSSTGDKLTIGQTIGGIAPVTGRFKARLGDGNYFADLKISSLANAEVAYQISAIIVDDYGQTVEDHNETEFVLDTSVNGAIEEAGDLDWYSVKLFAGVTYHINGLGVDSGERTLTDPAIRLLDSNGVELAADDNSGTGSNALIEFTPSATGKYLVEISGNGNSVGTYSISIPEMDEYPSDTSTTGSIAIEGPGTPGSFFSHNDIDWFSVQLKKYHHYEFYFQQPTNFNAFIHLNLYDSTGEFITGLTQKANTAFKITPPNSYSDGEFFVSASYVKEAGSGIFEGFQYKIAGRYGDKAEYFAFGQTAFGAIEVQDDIDIVKFVLLNDLEYTFTVVGQNNELETTLEDPRLVVRDQNGNIVAEDNDSGPGNQPFVALTSSTHSVYSFAIESQNGGTGSYQLVANVVDEVAGDATTSESLTFVDRIAKRGGRVEFTGDVDWYRLPVIEGHWYHVYTYKSTSNGETYNKLTLRDTTGEKLFEKNNFYFFAQKTGDYFLEQLSSGSVFYYKMEVDEGDRPDTIKRTDETIYNTSGTTYVAELFYPANHGGGLPDDTPFQVISDATFTYYDVEVGDYLRAKAGELVDLSLNQIANARFDNLYRSTADVFIRTGLPSLDPEQPAWSNWFSNSLISVIVPPQLISGTSNRFLRNISFAFATDLPDYYVDDDRVNNFQALSQASIDATRRAIGRFAEVTSLVFTELTPDSTNTNADIMIFGSTDTTSEIQSPIHGFNPGANAGYDIVFDTDNPLLNDLSDGSLGFFDLLRAVGFSLGMSPTTELSRFQSIMGRQTDSETANTVYNDRPMAADVLYLRTEFFQGTKKKPNRRATTYSFDDTPITTSINDANGADTIDVSESPAQWLIDLRPGNISHNFKSKPERTTFSIDHYSNIENVNGQKYRDYIIGNHVKNILFGNDGKDILDGRQGDDLLFGGKHNDVYIYRAGYGNDVINEATLGGNDRLSMELIEGFDKLEEDLTFERINWDLKINLEFDGPDLVIDDTILIKNQGVTSSRVETLIFADAGQNVERISLQSIWSQLVPGERMRFSITDLSDQFGSLVTPV